MNSSAICATSTRNSRRTKNIIFVQLPQTHPPNARDRPLESVGLVRLTPERGNFSLRQRATPTEKRRLLLKCKLSGRALGQPASIRNSGSEEALVPLWFVRQRRSPARVDRGTSSRCARM